MVKEKWSCTSGCLAWRRCNATTTQIIIIVIYFYGTTLMNL